MKMKGGRLVLISSGFLSILLIQFVNGEFPGTDDIIESYKINGREYTVDIGRKVKGKLGFGESCDEAFSRPDAMRIINKNYKKIFSNPNSTVQKEASKLICNKEKFLYCDIGNYTYDELGFVSYNATCQCVRFPVSRIFNRSPLVYSSRTGKCEFKVFAACNPFEPGSLNKESSHLYQNHYNNNRLHLSCPKRTECRNYLDVWHKRTSLSQETNRCLCYLGLSVNEDTGKCMKTPKEIEVKGIIAIWFIIATFLAFFGYIIYQESVGRFKIWDNRKPHY